MKFFNIIALSFSKYIPIAIIYNFKTINQQKNNFIDLLQNSISFYIFIVTFFKKEKKKTITKNSSFDSGKKYVGGLL